MSRFYVYIISNVSKMLYTGMTNDLSRRAHEHKYQPGGFTARYNIHQLIYYEEFTDVRNAIAREKGIKGWRREKKVALIESVNISWNDLGDT